MTVACRELRSPACVQRRGRRRPTPRLSQARRRHQQASELASAQRLLAQVRAARGRPVAASHTCLSLWVPFAEDKALADQWAGACCSFARHLNGGARRTGTAYSTQTSVATGLCLSSLMHWCARACAARRASTKQRARAREQAGDIGFRHSGLFGDRARRSAPLFVHAPECPPRAAGKPDVTVVTAVLDKMVVSQPIRTSRNLSLAGNVTWSGRSSMEVDIAITSHAPDNSSSMSAPRDRSLPFGSSSTHGAHRLVPRVGNVRYGGSPRRRHASTYSPPGLIAAVRSRRVPSAEGGARDRGTGCRRS
jgi:hypothetical protein